MITIASLKPCVSRFGRFYDNKPVITCGYREVDIEECLCCGITPLREKS